MRVGGRGGLVLDGVGEGLVWGWNKVGVGLEWGWCGVGWMGGGGGGEWGWVGWGSDEKDGVELDG